MKKAKKENSENEVTIRIGLMRLKDVELKVIRGSTLPLKVKCLPGGTEPFTLQRYKDELGKSYN